MLLATAIGILLATATPSEPQVPQDHPQQTAFVFADQRMVYDLNKKKRK